MYDFVKGKMTGVSGDFGEHSCFWAHIPGEVGTHLERKQAST